MNIIQTTLQFMDSALLNSSALWLSLRHQSVTDELVDNWASGTNIFFILGMGRSGTTFFASALDSPPDVFVTHEPTMLDFPAYTQAFHCPERARDYVDRYRKKEIYLRANRKKGQAPRTYGEVNSLLRRHLSALRETFPKARIIHLVRDGRDVVRSMLSRKLFTALDPITAQIFPKESDPYRQSWPRMDRFERLCWYWTVANQHVRPLADTSVQFEKLVTDYTYFERHLLNALDLQLSQSEWEKRTSTPKNATERHKAPHWREWSLERKQAFDKICGTEMQQCGYVYRWA